MHIVSILLCYVWLFIFLIEFKIFIVFLMGHIFLKTSYIFLKFFCEILLTKIILGLLNKSNNLRMVLVLISFENLIKLFFLKIDLIFLDIHLLDENSHLINLIFNKFFIQNFLFFYHVIYIVFILINRFFKDS